MILINGEANRHIEIFDRGFQYGDGLFETITVRNGRMPFWKQHFQRLSLGCHRLKLPPFDPELLLAEANQLAINTELGIVKIIITRGIGCRGYRQPDPICPTRVLSLHPYPGYPVAYERSGIVAHFCETPLGANPILAGIKHLNRLEQVLARAEWSDPDIQEGIMRDINGNVIEGTMTNLFFVKNDRLFTPAVDEAGIAGIMRHVIICLAAEHGLAFSEQKVTTEMLMSADEIFLCNSIIKIWPVRELGKNQFLIGPRTRQIQEWLEHHLETVLKQ